ncbi:uncharacterized protein LOC108808707 [Raphanus sativus]|uniref:Uncharacterized protein LOC108808707 n=1 Tax=Raphanus sativus TaxID=3726 RepID=A0A6J0JNC2_RAPSA|nr:uncharacterized protein LOC108808707 [Raphanus sativus]
MDLGIPIHTTVEGAIQMYRARRHRVNTLRMIEREILEVRSRGLSDEEDIYLWKRDNGDYKEDFRTSQTWNLIRDRSPKVLWAKGIWLSEATPKFAFITWLAMHNRLATGDRILLWNSQAVSTCWLCKTTMETRDHIFFDCSYSKEVWYGVVKNMAGSRRVHQWTDAVQVVIKGLQNRDLSILFRYCFQAVIYALWHERNVRSVGDPSVPVSCLVNRLDKQIRNRITTLRRKGKKYEKTMEVWFGRS